MFEALETGFGLDVVLALQASRSGLLDGLALILNSMGGPLFYLIVLLLVYWSLNRRIGVRLTAALIVGGVANGLLKAFFHRPRPNLVSDLVMPLVHEPGYGIPSGHVMISLVVW
ncbi:MAG: hypothetical protein K8J31_15395, partial [Anaerolineae bacterium]|nr:hypothetical protein [Anaerolineae bacterium]